MVDALLKSSILQFVVWVKFLQRGQSILPHMIWVVDPWDWLNVDIGDFCPPRLALHSGPKFRVYTAGQN